MNTDGHGSTWLRVKDQPGRLILSGTPLEVRYDPAGDSFMCFLLIIDGRRHARYATLGDAKQGAEARARELLEIGMIEESGKPS